MEKIAEQHRILKKYLTQRASLKLASSPGAKAHLIIDRENNEYLLLWVGWTESKYKHGLMFHFQIVDGKIWIHENRTDIDLVEVLTEAGVAKSDIVLGFVAPYARDGMTLEA